jgi:hypothetical protein
MKRYTAVFEFADGTEPGVTAGDGWKGGRIVSVEFRDCLNDDESERFKDTLRRIIAHTGTLPGAQNDLLLGLLASIKRIAEDNLYCGFQFPSNSSV